MSIPSSQFDSIAYSSKEGLITPFVELLLSMFVLTNIELHEIVHTVLVISNGSSTHAWSTKRVSKAVAVPGLFDLIRNFFLGLFKPVNILAFAMGELISLSLIIRTVYYAPSISEVLAESFHEVLTFCALGAITMLIEPLIRYLVSTYGKM